ncbi:MAG: DMT family transporter [Thermoleophilaceae bacterium]|nr:DMT family transporter [Thermoleophilaceae bacterium]
MNSFFARIPNPVLPMIAGISWGAMFPIAANAFDHVDPFNMSAIRYVGAGIIFVGLLFLIEGRQSFSYEGHPWRTSWFGTFGFAGFNLLAYVGLSHTEPQNAAVLMATMPLVAVLVRWWRDGTRPHPVTLVFIFTAIIGVALLVTKGHPSEISGGFGDLLVLAGVICWVFYTTSAAETPHWSPLRFTTLTVIPGAMAILLVTIAADLIGQQHAPSATDLGAAAPALAFIILFGAVAAVLSWNASVRRIGPDNTTLFITLVPITAFVIALAEGAQPTAAEFVGAGMILASLVAANLYGRRVAPAPARVAVRPDPAAAAQRA